MLLLVTLDAGEGYRYRGQRVPADRSLSEIAVGFAPGTKPHARRAALSALAGSEIVEEVSLRDTTVVRLHVPSIVGQGRMADPAQRRQAGRRLEQALSRARPRRCPLR